MSSNGPLSKTDGYAEATQQLAATSVADALASQKNSTVMHPIQLR